MSSRKVKVGQAMRDVLAEMIGREVKDPRVRAAGLLSVSNVELNDDLSVAQVYISIYADDRIADKAMAGLAGAAGYLRGPVGRRLNLNRPPELRFVRDQTAAVAQQLRSIVQDDEARAVAAGRDLAAEAAAAAAAAAAPAAQAAIRPAAPTAPEPQEPDAADPTGTEPDSAP